MTQSEHVCAICCRPEVGDDDVISGRNVKTLEGYLVVNFEVARSNSFEIFPQNHFVTAASMVDIDDSIKRKRFRVSLRNCKIFMSQRKVVISDIPIGC